MDTGSEVHTFDQAVIEQRLCFAIWCAFELSHSVRTQPQTLQFFQQGWGGLSFGVQTHTHRHEFLLDLFVSCFAFHLGYVGG